MGPYQGFGVGQVNTFASGCIDHGGQVILARHADPQPDPAVVQVADLLHGGAVDCMRLRRLSCRSMTSSSACSSAPGPSVPVSRIAHGTL